MLAGPLTDLRDGDSVALFGGGFVPNGQVAVVQCSQPAIQTCQTLQYLAADAQRWLHHARAGAPTARDAALRRDRLRRGARHLSAARAVSLTDYDFEAHVFLDFDPSGPLPAVQTTVTPDTDLLHFQTVTVSGTGFNPNGGVQIVQCTTDATSYEDCTQGSRLRGHQQHRELHQGNDRAPRAAPRER